MKRKIYYIIPGLSLLFISCDLTDPLKEKLESVNNNIVQVFEYTVTDTDFATIAKRALYLNPNDIENVNFLKTNRYFTDSVPASVYVPMLMDMLYPGLGTGTQARVSYNYNGNAPDELTRFSAAPVFTFSSDDYRMAANPVADAGYFSPRFNPDKSIPAILSERVDTASAGEVYAVSYKYAPADPLIDYSGYEINPEWVENFESSAKLTALTVINKTGNQKWNWNPADEGAVSIEGWDNGYYQNEDWILFQDIDLGNVSNTHLQFVHAVEYYTEGCLFVMISTNYNGENLETAKWHEMPFPGYQGSNKNNYTESDVIDISRFDGKKISLALKYLSTTTQAPYWGIGQIKVGPYGYKIQGETPYVRIDYYQFDGNDWSKPEDVYSLTQPDYKAMGVNSAFTKTEKASDYLPILAELQMPWAKEGDERIFVYKYFTGEETLTLADKLTLSSGAWHSGYDYIRLVSEPYASTPDGWVFDPTVNFTMASEDYLIIAAYVKNDPVLSELDNNNYVDSEYYFGASAYYRNFDTRNGRFHGATFASWEEAVVTAIGTVLLPLKYPDTVTEYKGIDLFYIVHFATYGTPSTYYWVKFQCTKAGPNPEFTLIEGPIAE